MRTTRTLLTAFFTVAGGLHFTRPAFYEAIVPPSLQSRKREVVAISGAAEIAGAVLLVPPATRRLGRWWLLALLVAVFPANVHMALHPERYRVPGGRLALYLRLPVQALFIAWAIAAGRD